MYFGSSSYQNVKIPNELRHLILSEETLTESIQNVKEVIEKIANRIEMTGRLIERPKFSCQKRKHLVSTSSTDRKKFKNLPANKIKKHPFAGRFGIKAEVIRRFLYAKVSLPNNPPEATESNAIIDGYVDDLTINTTKLPLLVNYVVSVNFFIMVIIYIYDISYISIAIANFH